MTTEQLIKGARIKGYVDDTYTENQEFTGIFSAQIDTNGDVTIVNKFPGPYNPNIKGTVTMLEAEITILQDEINTTTQTNQETPKNTTEKLARYETELTKINELLEKLPT